MSDALVTTHKPWRCTDGELFGCIRVIDHDQSKRVSYERPSDRLRDHARKKAHGPVSGVGLWSFKGKVKR